MSDKTSRRFGRIMAEANKTKVKIPICLTVHEYAMLVAVLQEALDERRHLRLEIKEQIRKLLDSVHAQALAWRDAQENIPCSISTCPAPPSIVGAEFPTARRRNTR